MTDDTPLWARKLAEHLTADEIAELRRGLRAERHRDATAAAWRELLADMTNGELVILADALDDHRLRHRLVLLDTDSLLDLTNGIRAQLALAD